VPSDKEARSDARALPSTRTDLADGEGRWRSPTAQAALPVEERNMLPLASGKHLLPSPFAFRVSITPRAMEGAARL
jgi:hypothetical protein